MTLLNFVNYHRFVRMGLPSLHALPCMDSARDLPRTMTHATNPLHVMIGLAFRNAITDWHMDASLSDDKVVVEFRYTVMATGQYVVSVLPDDVWLDLCTLYPNPASAILMACQSVETVWGLDEPALRIPKPRKATSSRPSRFRPTTMALRS